MWIIKSDISFFPALLGSGLVYAVATVPLLRQLTVTQVDALHVKPLSLAIFVLAKHHLSERRPSTVAVAGLVGVLLHLLPPLQHLLILFPPGLLVHLPV